MSTVVDAVLWLLVTLSDIIIGRGLLLLVDTVYAYLVFWIPLALAVAVVAWVAKRWKAGGAA